MCWRSFWLLGANSKKSKWKIFSFVHTFCLFAIRVNNLKVEPEWCKVKTYAKANAQNVLGQNKKWLSLFQLLQTNCHIKRNSSSQVGANSFKNLSHFSFNSSFFMEKCLTYIGIFHLPKLIFPRMQSFSPMHKISFN